MTAGVGDKAVQALDGDLSAWAHQCHAASLRVVRSGLLAPARVARGVCRGVGGQHSWVVLGDDCYADDALIMDPTLWSYDPSVEGVWVGSAREGLHVPHGKGSIWDWGRPKPPEREVIPLSPLKPWSPEAEAFLSLLGPLDIDGWHVIANAPVEGWPAREVFEGMMDSGLAELIPVDVRGMVTDRNPSGLYLVDGVAVDGCAADDPLGSAPPRGRHGMTPAEARVPQAVLNGSGA